MKEKRIQWLDLLRVFAMICVLLTHAVEKYVKFNLGAVQGHGFLWQCIVFGLHTVGRLGVPIFLFLTGYLSLGKVYSSEDIKRFYQRKLLPLFLLTEAWFLIQELCQIVITGDLPKPIHVVMRLLFLQDPIQSHMWYMPVILAIYLFLPFVSNALSGLKPSQIALPAGISFFVLLVYPQFRVLCDALDLSAPGMIFSLGFSGGAYGFYCILGYLLREKAFRRIPTSALAVVWLLSMAVIVLTEVLSYAMDIRYVVWYSNSASLAMAALCIFELTARREPSCPMLVTKLAFYSFDIYLIHKTINSLITLPKMRLFVKIPLQCLVVLAISAVLVVVLNRNKVVRKYLFYH